MSAGGKEGGFEVWESTVLNRFESESKLLVHMLYILVRN